MEYILSVSGPTGAGKSTFLSAFENIDNYDIISESLPIKLFDRFKNNPHKYCYQLQKNIMQSRMDSFRKCTKSIKIFDRNTSEDFEVFINMHYKIGLLSKEQFNDLRSIYVTSQKIIRKADLVIYINSNISCIEQRLINKCAPKIIISNLQLQLDLYEKWKDSVDTKIVEIDNSNLELNSFKKIAKHYSQELATRKD